MRILGLDVGERRIGMALSDPLGLTAQPLSVLERRAAADDLRAIGSLVERHHVETVVVGLPLTLRGEHGEQAQRASSFAAALRRQISVPVRLVDERLTTVQGARALREAGAPRRARKQVIDRVAAQLILQHFLESERMRHPEPTHDD